MWEEFQAGLETLKGGWVLPVLPVLPSMHLGNNSFHLQPIRTHSVSVTSKTLQSPAKGVRGQDLSSLFSPEHLPVYISISPSQYFQ